MAKKTWLCEAGHGGINEDGIYVTAPNFDPKKPDTWYKSYYHNENVRIYEGEYNRKIRDELIKLINEDGGMQWFIVNHGYEDVSLRKRCNIANEYQAKHGDCVFVSIHGNGGGGYGIEGYTSIGLTKSDPICTVFLEQATKEFPEKKMRLDPSDPEKDPDKEARFTVLTDTTCPALLMEWFFMDTLKDCKFMLTEECHQRVAKAMYNAMKIVDASPEL